MISLRAAAKIATVVRSDCGVDLNTPHGVVAAARRRQHYEFQISEEEFLEMGNAFAASIAHNIRHRRAELRLPATRFEGFCRMLEELGPRDDVPMDKLDPIAAALKINFDVLIMHNAFDPHGDPSDLLDEELDEDESEAWKNGKAREDEA
jgi:hypothetical protein